MNRLAFETLDLEDDAAIEQLLRKEFESNQPRLLHILKVANKVQQSAILLNKISGINLDVNFLYRAALLHDIGYAEALKITGYHPLDGATYLSNRGYEAIARIIRCHSNASEFAELKGLPSIEVVRSVEADLITYWDVQVMPGGKVVRYSDRLQDIVSRHGKDSDVCRAHELASDRIEDILNVVSNLLSQAYEQ